MNTRATYPGTVKAGNHFSFQDWLKLAYRHGQIDVMQDGNGEWVVFANTAVLDQGFSWLVQRYNTDDESRAEFLITDMLEECTNTSLINTLFEAIREREPSEPVREALLAAKRAFAQKHMNMHLAYLMRLSGKSDIAAAQYDAEQRDIEDDLKRIRG
jgi:hypothetical protein